MPTLNNGNKTILAPAPKAPSKREMNYVTKSTLATIPYVVKALEEVGESPRVGILYSDSPESCPQLKTTDPYFPGVELETKVTLSDTVDAAVALIENPDLMGTSDTKPPCILNFANQSIIGGGFYSGSIAQEEDICRRTTLIDTLHPHFYPMAKNECIYSPNVTVFRENDRKGYQLMSLDNPNYYIEISVISLAAERSPTLNARMDYANESSRDLMANKMRLILRVAANAYHRRLVLGALGCGVFGHPPRAVAQLWHKVLSEEEFRGWFEMIVFAVYDLKDGQPVFSAFRDILHVDGVWVYPGGEGNKGENVVQVVPAAETKAIPRELFPETSKKDHNSQDEGNEKRSHGTVYTIGNREVVISSVSDDVEMSEVDSEERVSRSSLYSESD